VIPTAGATNVEPFSSSASAGASTVVLPVPSPSVGDPTAPAPTDTPASRLHKVLEELKRCLDQSRTRAFEEQLRELLAPDLLRALRGVGSEDKAVELVSPSDNGPLHIGAVHYISPSLGKWFRVLVGMDGAEGVLDIRPLELSQHDAAYEEVPREINIAVWKELRRPLVVELGNQQPTITIRPSKIDYLHINDTSWSHLKSLFTANQGAKDFYHIVVGQIPVESAPWAEASRLQLVDTLTQLYAIRETQRRYLVESGDVNAESGAAHPDEPEQRVLWRTLLFSLFLSIRMKEAAALVYTLIVPIYDCETIDDKELIAPRLGTFVGCFKGQPPSTEAELRSTISTIREAFLPAMRALAILELHVLETRGARNVVVIENIIRSCAILDGRVQRDLNVNQYRAFLQQHLDHLKPCSPEVRAGLREVLQMTGANKAMREIFGAIRLLVKSALVDGGLRPDTTIFLHSEPGCGKENIATLCHLLGPRCLVLPRFHKGMGNALATLKRTLMDWKKGEDFAGKDADWRDDLATTVKAFVSAFGSGDTSVEVKYEQVCEKLREVPLLGYTSSNCGNLDKDNAADLLFGSESRPGTIYRADKLVGTVLLDEVNTVDRGVANGLLRVLEKPHQITVHDDGKYKEQPVNIQVVFGSNRSPDQMLSDGFNSAFVFRIAARAFRIPPLRERKEDIALFVNQRIVNRQEEAKGSEDVLTKLRRISLDGLRLLCELQWPDNYRGLKGLVDALLEERIRREITDPELSFDEIIYVVSQREAMGRAGSQKTSAGGFRILMDTP
jgi:hypothetical protein